MASPTAEGETSAEATNGCVHHSAFPLPISSVVTRLTYLRQSFSDDKAAESTLHDESVVVTPRPESALSIDLVPSLDASPSRFSSKSSSNLSEPFLSPQRRLLLHPSFSPFDLTELRIPSIARSLDDYDSFSRDQLVSRIRELEFLVNVLDKSLLEQAASNLEASREEDDLYAEAEETLFLLRQFRDGRDGDAEE